MSAVFAELCQIAEESVALYERESKPLPSPMSGKDFVNTIQEKA